MGLKLFASFLNSAAAQTTAPAFQGVYFVSEAGTGNGFTSSTPMSYETFALLVLPINTIVKFLAGETA